MAHRNDLPDAKHIHALEDNLQDVEELLLMHHHVRNEKECNHDVRVLYRSAVVLLCACWEAFVEDLASASLECLLNMPSPVALPRVVLELVGKQHAGIDAWKLAGDGWRQQLRGHLSGVLALTVGKLNSPKSAKVDELFEKVTGLKDLSAHWKWRGMTASRARTRIDQLVEVRGDIAHRVRGPGGERVTKALVEDQVALVRHLACCSSNAMMLHVKSLVGKRPWEHYSVGTED